MADIFQDFPINAAPARVFEMISAPHGLDRWWTKRASGDPVEGGQYELWFGPEYDWRARVTRYVLESEFELEILRADNDWTGTRVGFHLEQRDGRTVVRFHHTGWPTLNEHYRVSCHCWAMYLRVLRRYLEHSEVVAYEDRLDV